jgi:AcrR family transcriptional regulator
MPRAGGTRERILDAASPVLYRDGVHGAGVDALVAATGVAKATLYRHFPSKDLLVEAFLRRRDGRWRAWLDDEVERRTAAGEEPLLAVFDALEDWFSTEDFRGCAFINAAAEITDPDHPALDAVREHKRLLRDHLVRLAARRGARAPDALGDAMLLLVEGARRAAAALLSAETPEAS